MEINGKVHCLFEQSGTFKQEFIRLGIPAEDYDIQDEFGQTDHRIDLFTEIEKAFVCVPSIFDNVGKDDLIMAFFPCIYFCENNALAMSTAHANYKYLQPKEMVYSILERSENRQRFYGLLLKMVAIVMDRGLRLILENPWSGSNYLKNNFLAAPQVIDRDRTIRGDSYRKPTAYWFFGCDPTEMETATPATEVRRIASMPPGEQAGICSTIRSTITPDYARNFICDFIIGKPQNNTQLSLFDANH